jgi:hypothetical protein
VEEPLRRLIEKGKEVGYLTYEDVNTALPEENDDATVDAILLAFQQHGIELIDAAEARERESPSDDVPAEAPSHFRDPALLSLVRDWGIPAIDAIGRRDAAGGLIDGSLLVPRSEAFRAWVTLRTHLDALPNWPVICEYQESYCFSPRDAAPADRQVTVDPEAFRQKARELIAEADRLPAEPWLQKQYWWASDLAGTFAPAVYDPPKPRPAWPSAEDFAWVLDLELMATAMERIGVEHDGPVPSERARPFACIRLAPTPIAWEVFAYWPYGGWNDAPWPAEQLAMVRHWDQKYGAELISRSFGYFEMAVWSPPRKEAAACRLIDETKWFGEENIFRDGNPSKEEQVRRAIERRLWYFWWD